MLLILVCGSHLRFSVLASTGRSFGTRTVLANVPSDGYDDLDRVTLLQGRCPLGKEPVSF